MGPVVAGVPQTSGPVNEPPHSTLAAGSVLAEPMRLISVAVEPMRLIPVPWRRLRGGRAGGCSPAAISEADATAAILAAIIRSSAK